MAVESVLTRAREHTRELSPRRFLALATTSLASLYLVVASGAVVRLTASGLGCDNWPKCGDKPFPEKGGHAAIEFGNRMVALAGIVVALLTWLGARKVRSLPPRVRLVALATFLGALAQVPLGGLTVILGLHPVAVMSHFLLALVVLAGAAVVAIEAWSNASGLAAPVGSRGLRRVAPAAIAACALLVVTGAVATASGPHSGGKEIPRLGIAIASAVYVHVRATAIYGVVLAAVVWAVLRLRREYPGVLALVLALLGLLVAQMAVGEVQYRTALPWWLVLVHVALAAAVWVATVVVVYVLWRPPAPLAARE